MPHLAGRCDCGRKMHFPNNAKIGYQWKCHQCGKIWTLSDRGKPLHSQNSKAPPKKPTLPSASPTYSTKPRRQKKQWHNYSQKSSLNPGLVVLAIVGLVLVFLILIK